MLLRFDGFNGCNLKEDSQLIPPGVGIDSDGQRLNVADLRGVGTPLNASVANVTAPGSIYWRGNPPYDETVGWMTFTPPDMDFVEWPATGRWYSTGGAFPKRDSSSDATGFRLGLPAQTTPPILSITTAGAGSPETRAYVVRSKNLVTGEVSKPTPAAVITCNSGATIQVLVPMTGFEPGYDTFNRYDVFRTVPGNASTDYFYVGTGTIVVAGSYNVANAFSDSPSTPPNTSFPLDSKDYDTPRDSMKGLTLCWNGFMAGFNGTTLCFSEPNIPWAWPRKYELELVDTIVALAVFRQTLVVLTNNRPYIVTGSLPINMSVQPVDQVEACLSKTGVVAFGYGVVYPSPNGLVLISDAGLRNLTEDLIEPYKWLTYGPDTFRAANYNGTYLAIQTVTFALPGNSSRRQFFYIDPLKPVGLYFYNDETYRCLRRIPQLNAVYLGPAATAPVRRWAANPNGQCAFESRTERTAKPTNLSCIQLVTSGSGSVEVSVWANDTLVVNAMLFSVPALMSRPRRLPSGFLADRWRIRVKSFGSAVQAVLLANNIEELNEV